MTAQMFPARMKNPERPSRAFETDGTRKTVINTISHFPLANMDPPMWRYSNGAISLLYRNLVACHPYVYLDGIDDEQGHDGGPALGLSAPGNHGEEDAVQHRGGRGSVQHDRSAPELLIVLVRFVQYTQAAERYLVESRGTNQ